MARARRRPARDWEQDKSWEQEHPAFDLTQFCGRSIPAQRDPVKPELRRCVHPKMHCLGSSLCIASAARLPGESQSNERPVFRTAHRRNCMASRKVSRRRFVASTAALSGAMVAAPFVRGAYAAGKLAIGFWDHWVPNANSATEKAVKEWAEKEKVEVTIDFITSQGNKLLLTTAAEQQARSGHDILAMNTFLPARYSEQLVPVNDLMETLIT